MGLVHDEGAGIRENGLDPSAAMDGIRQQQVVVADLEEVLSGIAILQKGAIAAVFPLAVTGLGNADTLPVIAAEMGCLAHIELAPEGDQSRTGFPVLLAQIQLAQLLL